MRWFGPVSEFVLARQRVPEMMRSELPRIVGWCPKTDDAAILWLVFVSSSMPGICPPTYFPFNLARLELYALYHEWGVMDIRDRDWFTYCAANGAIEMMRLSLKRTTFDAHTLQEARRRAPDGGRIVKMLDRVLARQAGPGCAVA